MKNLILFLMIVAVMSCSKGSNEDAAAVHVDLMSVPEPVGNQEPQVPVDKSVGVRRLIKDGYIEFESSDIEETRKQILAAVSANEAYVSSDREEKFSDKTTQTLLIRVPSAKFDSFLSSATKGVRYFDEKRINVKDVSAEYLDNEARLKTKKEIEARYLQLLNKASTVKDILEIEKELGAIRTEIESAEGQLKLLTDQIRYSSLEINFYKVTSTPSVFSYQIKSAFLKGWENLLFISVLLVDVWPFILLFFGIWFGFRKMRMKRLKKTGYEINQV